ncbi:MAG: hypothetical protein ACRENX_04640 [Candidatus Dormibacteria bacterium]
MDFTTKSPKERLYVLLHGGEPTVGDRDVTPGTILHLDPPALLAALEGMGLVPEEHTGDILLYSCFSGLTLTAGDQSFGQRFATLLRGRGYKGAVHAVEGSLNPLRVPKEAPIEVSHLSQSDPTFVRLQAIQKVFLDASEDLGGVEEELEVVDAPAAETPESGDVIKRVDRLPTLNSFIFRALTAANIADHAAKNIGPFGDQAERLGAWREGLVSAASSLFNITKGRKSLYVQTLESEVRQALETAVGEVRTVEAQFGQILGGYEKMFP